ncbi:MAG: hypothetical protein PVH36_03690 [Desulfobacterales bacterium]
MSSFNIHQFSDALLLYPRYRSETAYIQQRHLTEAEGFWAGFVLHLPQPKRLQDLFYDFRILNKGDHSHRLPASLISRGRALGK